MRQTAGADLVVVHHGLFWDRDPRVVDVPMRARLEALFRSNVNLAAYHLALDAHPDVGNNALLCRVLGIEPIRALRATWDSAVRLPGPRGSATLQS